MITLTNYYGKPNSELAEFVGLSTDVRPIATYGEDKLEIKNGSTFFCMDTGAMYMYDQEHEIWYEI